jgi:hypothetical protein
VPSCVLGPCTGTCIKNRGIKYEYITSYLIPKPSEVEASAQQACPFHELPVVQFGARKYKVVGT